MKLKTDRLWIRPFEFNDLNDMHEYCRQKVVAENAGWSAHQTRGESAEILSSWISSGNKYAIELLDHHKVVGHIAIDPDSEEGRVDTRELGCALNREVHRHGIMNEAILAVVSHLFIEEAVEVIWVCCFQSNVASKGMIEKCGFKFVQEGTFYSSSLDQEFVSFEYCIVKGQETH